MAEYYGYWIDDILLNTKQFPQGFVLNPRGWYTLSEQAARRRAAYTLQRRKQVTLIQSTKKGATCPIIVMPYSEVGYSDKNATEDVIDDPRAMLRRMIDYASFLRWLITGHRTRLQRAYDGKPITVVQIADSLGVSQPRVSQLLKEYSIEQSDAINQCIELIEQRRAAQQ